MSEIIKKYHSRWIEDKKDLKKQEYLSARVFETIELLFTKILKREFKGKLLDVACGDGSFVKVCNKKGLEAGGIDINHGCDFESDKLPYGDNEFDIVFMYSIVEHLHNPDNILNEIKRVLKKNGVVTIITPEWRYSFKSFYEDPTHIRPYTSRSLSLLMGMYHFKKSFLGLWTVKKSPLVWKMPENFQFLYGKLLPFSGLNKYAPGFLKGKSTTMLACFINYKEKD